MPDWIYWAGWSFVGVVLAVVGLFSWRRRKTTINRVTDGDNNDQSGGDGETVNIVNRGSGNVQKG